jgi:hypothetical protein
MGRATNTTNILTWNSRGIRNKIDELRLLIGELNIDIAIITETFLTPQIKISIPGFTSYRTDRPLRSGGGVAIFIRNTIKHIHIPNPITTNLETVIIQLTINQIPHIIAAAYNSPSDDLLSTDLDAVFGLGNAVIIAGDFNAKHPLWNCARVDRQGASLISYAQNTDIHILYPDSDTHYPTNGRSPSTLDIILAQNAPTTSNPKTLQALSSDHLPVYFTLGWSHEVLRSQRLDYAGADWDGFKSHIDKHISLTSPLPKTPTDINATITFLTDIINDAKRTFIPTKTFQQYTLQIPESTKKLITRRNQLRKIWQRTRESTLKTLINRLTYHIRKQIKNVKDEAWTKKIEKLTPNDNSLWKFSKYIRNERSSIPVLDDGNSKAITNSEKAGMLAATFQKSHTISQHFHHNPTSKLVTSSLESFSKLNHADLSKIKLIHPCEVKSIIRNLKNSKSPGLDSIENIVIKHLPFKCIIFLVKIFNSCLLTSTFPDSWKVAKIIPIKKPGKPNQFPLSYRPISLLSSISKIFEKLILDRLSSHISSSIKAEQFGFRPMHSTVHQLTRLTEHVSMNFNMKRSTGMVLLDIEKAFDTVWHDGLIHKLISINVPPLLISLIKDYLTNRSFVVSVNDTISSPRNIPAGVPQGSLLGPFLFNVFINDIPNPAGCEIALYADDTAVFTSSRSPNLIRKNLQNALTTLATFFRKWKIKINDAKTEAIIFSVRRQPRPPPLTSTTGSPILWSNQVKYLGLILDTKLKWKSHTEHARNKGMAAMSALYPLFNRRSPLSTRTRLLLYNTLIRPTISYASPTFSNAAHTHIKRLQVVQNKALKTIYNTPFYTNLTKLHSNNNIPTLVEYIHKLTDKYYSKTDHNHNLLIKNLGNYSSANLPFKYKHKLPKHILL